MPDFYTISTNVKSNGVTEITVKFITGKRKDLMIKGGDFYAAWIERNNKGLWTTDEDDVIKAIDQDLKEYVENNKDHLRSGYSVKYMWDSDSGAIDRWHKYCKQQLRDNFVPLNSKVIFANQETTRESYASMKLNYPIGKGPTESYDELMNVLYSQEEKMKLEWAIGAIVSGDSVNIQKFMVLYGDKGTGKGTFLKILAMLFDGYCSSFEAKVVVSGQSAFPLEAFRDNPLVAIDSDGDLGSIGDNTRLNALTSHEIMPINTKNEKVFNARINSFLFIGSNKPVKITDAKSGLLRRLIDVNPTGNKVPEKEYRRLMKNIEFEKGAIAQHCLDVYNEKPDRYNNYVPISMMGITNDFYNFMQEHLQLFMKDDGISMKAGWEMYKAYCEDARVPYPFSQRIFRDEMRNYFKEYYDRYSLNDGTRVRSYYKGFRIDKFVIDNVDISEEPKESWIVFKEQHSLLDDILADCPAQEAVFDEDGHDRPKYKWANCKTTLKDIDTTKLHYIVQKGHEDLIRIDFDFKNSQGEKDPDINLKEASKWPKTYAERSKSGAGIHLYYIYQGDTGKLSRMYDSEIEIKVASGNSSIRRKLTVCNDIPIATISSGLPLKGDDKVVHDEKAVLNERQLRTFIKRALSKEHHGHTKPEVDFIYKVLEDKYASGEPYDISDMRNAVLAFAASSTHQSKEAVKKVAEMKFRSKDIEEQETAVPDDFMNKPEGDYANNIIFFDCEVYPNKNCICWNKIGSDEVHVLDCPSPDAALAFQNLPYKVGFNCRRYDNHITRGMSIGMSPGEIFNLSQDIINNKKGFFPDAYNISFTDIWDYASDKRSLKKWEIKLGIDHKEVNFPWDQPISDEDWPKVIEYCKNDVLATKAVWLDTQSDFLAREILADLTGLTVNDTTNTHTGRLIFGSNKNPQSQFNYRDLSKPVLDGDLVFTAWNGEKSAMPFFPTYEYKAGKSYYRGELVGEGGYVYAETGIWDKIILLDVASMHPHSIIAERLFGPYTDIFAELVQARVIIKHAVSAHKHGNMDEYEKQLDMVRALPNFGKKLSKYLSNFDKLKNLPQALKIAINSVYGLTAASFKNPFRDPRNVDNIVAKRGALFMIDLKHAVQEKGFTVAHIKTDSIKIPGATPEIIDFVMEFGKKYGYSFEIDGKYEKMALVNDAVYIAKLQEPYTDEKTGEDIWWTATGAQFQVPYVYKKLFSGQKIVFDDFCETKAVSSSLYLDFNEGLPDDAELVKERNKLEYETLKEVVNEKDASENAERLKILNDEIAACHKYMFVGKVGRFCPVKHGFGGGALYREQNGKYYAVAGTTGYRWKESEVVKNLGLQDQIDISYYDRLCDEAVKTINEVGEPFGKDYGYLVTDEPYEKIEEPVELPWN